MSRKEAEKVERPACARILAEFGITNSKLGQQGDPDRVFWLPRGKSVLIEFKDPDGEVSALQTYKLTKFQGLGHEAHVCDTVEAAVEIVRRALETATLHAQGREVPSSACKRGTATKPRRKKN